MRSGLVFLGLAAAAPVAAAQPAYTIQPQPTLAQAQARVSNARQRALATGSSRAQVQVKEAGGKATLRWDAEATPFLSVTWTDGTRRLNLAQDLQGGEVTLDTQELPTGGRFEFIVSDGLNAQRVELSR